MTAYNKIYVSVLKNNTNHEATIIASSFSNDRFRRDIENLPRFLQVVLPPLTHNNPHIGRSERNVICNELKWKYLIARLHEWISPQHRWFWGV